jgi:hypothetical protein
MNIEKSFYQSKMEVARISSELHKRQIEEGSIGNRGLLRFKTQRGRPSQLSISKNFSGS